MSTRAKSDHTEPSELGRCDWWRYNNNAQKLQYSSESRVPKLLTLIPRRVTPQELTSTWQKPSTCTYSKIMINEMVRKNDSKKNWLVWNNLIGIVVWKDLHCEVSCGVVHFDVHRAYACGNFVKDRRRRYHYWVHLQQAIQLRNGLRKRCVVSIYCNCW